MNLKILILFSLLFVNSTVCLSQYEYFWERKFGVDDYRGARDLVGGRDEARDLIETSDNDIVLTGYTRYKSKRLLWIAKINSAGYLMWGKMIEKNGNAVAESIIETSDKGFLIAGKAKNNLLTNYDILVIKLDSAGNVIWEKLYGDYFDDGAFSAIETSDGGYLVGGYSETAERDDDYRLIKIDSEGTVIWDQQYGGSKKDRIHDVIETQDMGYLHVGFAQGKGLSERSFAVTKMTSDGEIIWEEYYNDEGFERTVASSAVQLADGNLAVAGYCKEKGVMKYDMKVVCMDSDGGKIWDNVYSRANWGEATSIIQTYDKKIVVTGFNQYYNGEQSDFWIVKLDSTGREKWDLIFKRRSLDYANAIIETYDKGLVVAGCSYAIGSISWDFAVLKFKNSYFPSTLTLTLTDPWETYKTTTSGYYNLKGCVQSPSELSSLEIMINDKSWKGNLLDIYNFQRNDTCDIPLDINLPLKKGRNSIQLKASSKKEGEKKTGMHHVFYLPHFITEW